MSDICTHHVIWKPNDKTQNHLNSQKLNVPI